MNETFDWKRIQHLFKLGILASLMVLTGDMLLGWGVCDPSVTEIPALFTRYLFVSDGRIFASALLGLIGIPVECLCWFAIYRMKKPFSEKDETKVQVALSRLLAGKTVLVIAHRMRTVEAADKIVVLSDGTVAEEGSHNELLEKENGIFRRMTKLQNASAEWTIQ